MKVINRRDLLISAAGAGLTACASSPVISNNEARVNSTLELSNEQLVNDFCADWATGDVDVLAQYLSDDIAYQIVEHVPMVNNVSEFKQRVRPFVSNFNSIRWEILRSSVMGPVVLNDRIDYYEEPIKGESMIFYVVGTFVVQDNKIIDWRDWSTPVVRKPSSSPASEQS